MSIDLSAEKIIKNPSLTLIDVLDSISEDERKRIGIDKIDELICDIFNYPGYSRDTNQTMDQAFYKLKIDKSVNNRYGLQTNFIIKCLNIISDKQLNYIINENNSNKYTLGKLKLICCINDVTRLERENMMALFTNLMKNTAPLKRVLSRASNIDKSKIDFGSQNFRRTTTDFFQIKGKRLGGLTDKSIHNLSLTEDDLDEFTKIQFLKFMIIFNKNLPHIIDEDVKLKYLRNRIAKKVMDNDDRARAVNMLFHALEQYRYREGNQEGKEAVSA